VRALRWVTIVPSPITNPYIDPQKFLTNLQLKNPQSNYMCASACFFVFVAGTFREADSTDINENSFLGIHRPYLTDNELRVLSGDQAIASVNLVRGVVEKYMKEMGVQAKYVDLMYSIPKDDIKWIDKADFAADFNGDILELKDWIDARCNKLTDAEKAFSKNVGDKSLNQLTDTEKSIWDVFIQKIKVQVDCEWNMREQLRKDAWAQMFKSKGGWMSWWRRIWEGAAPTR
jgi:hypothetical protein